MRFMQCTISNLKTTCVELLEYFLRQFTTVSASAAVLGNIFFFKDSYIMLCV